jgi:hypothetical protein
VAVTPRETVWRERFGFAIAVAAAMSVATVVVAIAYNLPIRDPDDATGPTYLRLPLILLIAFLTDVAPRAAHRAYGGGSPQGFLAQFAAVTRERWPYDHIRFALLGLGSWYVTYVAFRNLKSYVPVVNRGLDDNTLARIDRWMFFGHDPAALLHDLLGTDLAAHVLSFVYIAWIVLVPVSLAAALVWSRSVSGGSWLVTAVGVDWALGAITYYLVPSVGPVYIHPDVFAGLAHTSVTSIQEAMADDRASVLADPSGTHAVQTIAAFASLHVGITVTVCLIAYWLGLSRWIQCALAAFLAATIVSTVYLGWHYATDCLGGIVLGVLGAWIGALGTGNHARGWPVHRSIAKAVTKA